MIFCFLFPSKRLPESHEAPTYRIENLDSEGVAGNNRESRIINTVSKGSIGTEAYTILVSDGGDIIIAGRSIHPRWQWKPITSFLGACQ